MFILFFFGILIALLITLFTHKLYSAFGVRDPEPIQQPKTKQLETKTVSKNPFWTRRDEYQERQLYLEGTSAFWLNPNRFQEDGGYDLLADEHQEVVEDRKLRPLGKWTYSHGGDDGSGF